MNASRKHPGVARILGRALRRRCPNCGAGGVFLSWFKMVPKCPRCGLLFDRGEQGYVVGAYMFNIAAAELAFVALFVGMLAATWPDPPWRIIGWTSGGVALILPFIFYPFSKTLFLGFDLLFHPAETPGEE